MATLPLRGRRNHRVVTVGSTTVDPDIAERFADAKLSMKNTYVGLVTRVAGKCEVLYLHRVILGLTKGDGLEVDHINGDTLDNRRANLRVVTRAQNAQNSPVHRSGSSRYRGVRWHKLRRKWAAEVRVDRKTHHLGLFEDEEDAARAAVEGRARLLPYSTEHRSIRAAA